MKRRHNLITLSALLLAVGACTDGPVLVDTEYEDIVRNRDKATAITFATFSDRNTRAVPTVADLEFYHTTFKVYATKTSNGGSKIQPIFEGDTVLLPVWEIVQSLPCYPISTNYTEGVCRFELGGAEYLLDEPAMTLTRVGETENLIQPAPGSEGFRSEMINSCWMVDLTTVQALLAGHADVGVDWENEIVTITGP